mgnify:CR=1 FL=1
MAFIKNEYACGIGVQELAEHLNVNRSYLYTIFMNELHISPKDFLQKYRVTRARELLVLTELSVESIGNPVAMEMQNGLPGHSSMKQD